MNAHKHCTELFRYFTKFGIAIGVALTLLSACQITPPADPPTLEERGEQLFLTETFDGNGRTCGSCHRPTDNFGLTPAFIAALPDDDPVFIAETNPDLESLGQE